MTLTCRYISIFRENSQVLGVIRFPGLVYIVKDPLWSVPLRRHVFFVQCIYTLYSLVNSMPFSRSCLFFSLCIVCVTFASLALTSLFSLPLCGSVPFVRVCACVFFVSFSALFRSQCPLVLA